MFRFNVNVVVAVELHDALMSLLQRDLFGFSSAISLRLSLYEMIFLTMDDASLPGTVLSLLTPRGTSMSGSGSLGALGRRGIGGDMGTDAFAALGLAGGETGTFK